MNRRLRAVALSCVAAIAVGAALPRTTGAAPLNVVEYPVGGAVYFTAAGPDGAVWFAEKQGARLGRITRNGTIREFAVPPPTAGAPSPGVLEITTGPDGALWFTSAAPYAGRMTTAGVFSWIPLSASTIGVAPDHAGNLWYTETNGEVARVSTAGAVMEFPAVPSGNGPALITAGADGAMWFSEYAQAIGRITSAGVYTEFALDHPSFGACVAAGPGGHVWIAEQGYLAEVTGTGAMIDHRAAASVSNGCLAAGKNGSVWFSTANGVARRDAAGSVAAFASPSGLRSYGICRGPDDRIWTAEGTALARWSLGG